MKIIKILFPLLLSLSFFLINSCQIDSPNGGPDMNTVHGTVLGYNNYPLSRLIVEVDGKRMSTDIFGDFNFYDISPVFDIYIEDVFRNYKIIYKNVIEGNYYINLPLDYIDPMIDYVIDVQCPTLPLGTKGKLYFKSGWGFPCIQNLDSSSIMIIRTAQLYGPTGIVSLITYTTDANGQINDYTYFAQKEVTLTSEGTTVITILGNELQTVNERLVNVNITPVQGSTYLKSDLIFNFNFSQRNNLEIIPQSIKTFAGTNFSVLIPISEYSPYFSPSLCVSTDGSNGNSEEMILFSNNTTLNINPTDGPYLLTPINNATNVDSNTIFSYIKQIKSNTVIFTLIDTVNNDTYNLCTSDNSFTLKMLSPMVKLAPNRTYAYKLSQVGLKEQNVVEFLKSGRSIPSFTGTSPKRYFTTKP